MQKLLYIFIYPFIMVYNFLYDNDADKIHRL